MALWIPSCCCNSESSLLLDITGAVGAAATAEEADRLFPKCLQTILSPAGKFPCLTLFALLAGGASVLSVSGWLFSADVVDFDGEVFCAEATVEGGGGREGADAFSPEPKLSWPENLSFSAYRFETRM